MRKIRGLGPTQPPPQPPQALSRLAALAENPYAQGGTLAAIAACICIATPAAIATALAPALPWIAALAVLPAALQFLRRCLFQVATGAVGAAVAAGIALLCAAGSPFVGPIVLAAALVGGLVGVAGATYLRQLLAFLTVAGASYRIFGPVASAGAAGSTAGAAAGLGLLASNATWLSVVAGVTLAGLYANDWYQQAKAE